MELEEIQKIKKSIDEIGFENTASIYAYQIQLVWGKYRLVSRHSYQKIYLK